MAVPNTKERKTLAKMGVAMPDGSFYIRNVAELDDAINAVGRATPNAGETEDQRRNAVRRHIMKRAKAPEINRPDKIPDTWNADGSLKHDAWISEVEEYLEHYGVKGMHWRHHNVGHLKPGSAPGKGRLSNLTPDQRKFQIDRLTAHLADLKKQRSAGKPGSWHGHNSILRAEARLHVLQMQQRQHETRNNLPKGSSGGPVSKPPLNIKQSDEIDEFLMHFGRKGMHWGVHTDTRGTGTGLPAKATPSKTTTFSKRAAEKSAVLKLDSKKHSDLAKEHTNAMLSYHKDLQDLQQNGFKSKIAKSRYGEHAHLEHPVSFYRNHGISMHEAYRQMHNRQVLQINDHARQAAYHEKQAAKLAAKAAKVQHDDFDVDEFLMHFGRKGMKWGEHRFGRDRGTTVHPLSTDAAKAHELQSRVKAHGTSSLSNAELQHLVTRLNLEQQHGRLTPDSSQVKSGHEFVKTVLSLSKTGLDAYNTGKQIKNVVDELSKLKR